MDLIKSHKTRPALSLTSPCISAWGVNLSSQICRTLTFMGHSLLTHVIWMITTYLRAVVEILVLRMVPGT